jgi:hypothetical protein
VAAQELNMNITVAARAKESMNFFIKNLFYRVQKLIREVPKDAWAGSVIP